MKIKKVVFKEFKRFTDLTIEGIPNTAKLVVLVGPNGCGKTSVFEGLNIWRQLHGYHHHGEQEYLLKKGSDRSGSTWYIDQVDVDFHGADSVSNDVARSAFYFRTAYRHEPAFSVETLKKQQNPTEIIGLRTLMQTEKTVSENYQRLISKTLSGVYEADNDEKTVEQLRTEIIGKIKVSMSRIFDDLKLSSIGEPLTSGSFYFEKGTSSDFDYKNLSGGEKSVFDLILDIILKADFYPEAVYCIDEPEAHMHTRLQSKLLRELFRLVPEDSQLWISTHSVGMLKEAEDIDSQNPGSVVFLDFDGRDFDLTEVIRPAKIDKTIWERFFQLAFGDFSNLIAPKRIVFCEGSDSGRSQKGFDAFVYSKIFESKYYDTEFISVGSSTEIEDIENESIRIVSNILKSSEIIKFVDRDDKSEYEVEKLLEKDVTTSGRRHIESYLLDDEIIAKLCESVEQTDKLYECIQARSSAVEASVARGNPPDDIKSASGEIYVAIKRILQLTQCGNNTTAFLRDTMAPLVTEETGVYSELEGEIFQHALCKNAI